MHSARGACGSHQSERAGDIPVLAIGPAGEAGLAIAEDFTCRIVTGYAADATTRMGTGTAHVERIYRASVAAHAQHGTG